MVSSARLPGCLLPGSSPAALPEVEGREATVYDRDDNKANDKDKKRNS